MVRTCAPPILSKMVSIWGIGQEVISFRCRQSMQNHRQPSGFRAKSRTLCHGLVVSSMAPMVSMVCIPFLSASFRAISVGHNGTQTTFPGMLECYVLPPRPYPVYHERCPGNLPIPVGSDVAASPTWGVQLPPGTAALGTVLCPHRSTLFLHCTTRAPLVPL